MLIFLEWEIVGVPPPLTALASVGSGNREFVQV